MSANKTSAGKTPFELGFRMPGEFEPHRATWLAWPHNEEDWPDKLDAVKWAYTEFVGKLAASETVRLEVHDEETEKDARDRLERSGVDLSLVTFHRYPNDRGWTRDHGPLFVVRPGELALTDWRFNAWAKYPNFELDNAIPAQIARDFELQHFVVKEGERHVVMEGGAIDVNGSGTLLTTEECLLSPIQERNPGFGREDYERVFRDWLGVTNVVWLGNGVAGDDTHGHVDDIARFVSQHTIVAIRSDDRQDVDWEPLEDNYDRLKSARDENGRPFDVVALPCPSPIYFEGERLPASYANFLITNKSILVPTFNDPKDRVALETLGRLFPTRTVVGVHAVDLVWGFGTLHCLSQQEPAIPPRE